MSLDRYATSWVAEGTQQQCAYCRRALFTAAHDTDQATRDPSFALRNTPPRPVVADNGFCSDCQHFAAAPVR